MATLELQKIDGGKGGSVELSDAVFGAEVNERTVRTVYNQYMAAQRAGTNSVKTRGTVRGGGRKPYRQKGTGRARQGSIRAPQWRGGAVVHGPSPRSYAYSVNKRVRRSAFRSLLSSHREQGTLTVVESFELPEAKTKLFVEAIEKLGLGDARRLLVVTASTDENLLFASRNLQHVKVIHVDNINIYDLLAAYHVVLVREAAEVLSRRFEAVPRAFAAAGEAESGEEA